MTFTCEAAVERGPVIGSAGGGDRPIEDGVNGVRLPGPEDLVAVSLSGEVPERLIGPVC